MSQSEFKKRLKVLMLRPENQVCSDCPERQPRWASLIVPPPGSPPGSLAMGALCCLECSGSHRRLGVHISFVRSITLDSWKEKEVVAMENGGNGKVNSIFEAKLHNPAAKPTTGASGPVRERYIRDKYEYRKYYDPSVLQNYVDAPPDPAPASPARSRQPVSRAPSEAARLRAQARQVQVPRGRTLPSVSASMPVSAPPAPEVDLLDFSAPITDPGSPPMPNPPSAAPSPTLDLFKNMNAGNMNAGGGHGHGHSGMVRSATNPNPMLNKLAPQVESKKMTSDDILAMFHTPSAPQQQQFGNFSNQQQFGNFSNMNAMPMGNGNSNGNGNGNVNNNTMNAMGMNQNQQQQQNNNMMMNQQQQQQYNNMMMNNNGMGNTFNQNQANAMAQQQNMFAGMPQQNNMMGGSGMNHHQNMNQGMAMNSQQQQQNVGMSNNNMSQPMGGTPSNMNTMGGNGHGHGHGNGMNQPYQMAAGNNNSMHNQGGNANNNAQNGNGGQYGNVPMGGAPANNQQQQFASFGSFR